ncbi:hypothetical protein ACRJ4B_39085 [Streptomyces sp. GTA36]
MVHTPRHQAESLLNALDPLPYPLRMRELAARTRELEETRPLLDELESRGAYERGLAVVAASVAGDTEWIAARIADPDSFVRGHALRTADSLQVPDSAYESALTDAPEVIRRQLLRAVVAGRRTALADRLVDGVRAEWGDEEAARLLPGCSPETVARLLPALLHAVQGSKSLGRRHPGALLDVAERELAALPESLRDAWWQRYTQVVVVTVTAEPLRVLELIERLGPSRIPSQLLDQVGAFAAVAPERVLRLLISGPLPLLHRRAQSLAATQAGPIRGGGTRRPRADAGRVGWPRTAPPGTAARSSARLLHGVDGGPGRGRCHRGRGHP